MATQQGPPSRPWFRLATMARPPAPAPPQPDQPAPPPTTRPPPAFVRPAFTQPPQPPANAVAPPPQPSPMPPSSNPRTSPQPPRSTAPSFTANRAPTFNRATSSPPKTVKPPEKTPPSSPDIKPLSRPPSPLALPSPQLKSYQPPEYDQKRVLVQETKEKPKAQNNGDLRRNMARDTNNPINDAPKKPEASKNHHPESEDLGMTIITISGENKGAIMDLTTPSVNNKTHHKFGNNPNSLNPTASSDGEKSGSNSDSKSKAKKNKNQKSKSPLMSTAVMNSNVQAVNNSILYNCSTTHHDPGIHLSLSRKPGGARGLFLKDQKDHIN